jgi:hypothetical protein
MTYVPGHYGLFKMRWKINQIQQVKITPSKAES